MVGSHEHRAVEEAGSVYPCTSIVHYCNKAVISCGPPYVFLCIPSLPFEPWVYCQDSVFRVHDTWKTKAQAGDVIPSHTAFLQEDQSQAAGFLQRALIVVMKTLDALLGYQVSL